ncbi:MAG: redoxin domain-containing protein [Deltaproteobacteria bacterium]|nr:redoxin domain-containing protein [Deltaproteobacteria bacterium]MCL5792061.1 redoxin domain-containing protein [Deltaproteobacteria bacterium]
MTAKEKNAGRSGLIIKASIIVILLLTGVLGYIGISRTTPQQESKSGITGQLSDNAQLIQPADLVKLLQLKKEEQPLILHVGFLSLYNQSHIPGADYVGAASSPEGLQKLRELLKDLSRNKFIVLYCGCCPWNNCPNIRPAYKELMAMGFTNVKMLYLPNGFVIDWVQKGYPVVSGTGNNNASGEGSNLPNNQGPVENENAPDFKLPTVENKIVNLSSYRGKVVLLNFWATWCPPCKMELPSMERLSEKLKGQPFVILGVNVDESNPDHVKTFIQKMGITFPILIDNGSVSNEYRVNGIPITFIIRKDGTIYDIVNGARSWDKNSYVNVFKKLIAEPYIKHKHT